MTDVNTVAYVLGIVLLFLVIIVIVVSLSKPSKPAVYHSDGGRVYHAHPAAASEGCPNLMDEGNQVVGAEQAHFDISESHNHPVKAIDYNAEAGAPAQNKDQVFGGDKKTTGPFLGNSPSGAPRPFDSNNNRVGAPRPFDSNNNRVGATDINRKGCPSSSLGCLVSQANIQQSSRTGTTKQEAVSTHSLTKLRESPETETKVVDQGLVFSQPTIERTDDVSKRRAEGF